MTPKELSYLANTLAEHEGITHWAISARIFGRGDVFSRFDDGKNCFHTTTTRATEWFAANWPANLDWPEGLERPARQLDMRVAS